MPTQQSVHHLGRSGESAKQDKPIKAFIIQRAFLKSSFVYSVGWYSVCGSFLTKRKKIYININTIGLIHKFVTFLFLFNKQNT